MAMSPRLKKLLCQTELQVLLVCIFLLLFLAPVLRGDGPEQAAAAFFYLFTVWGVAIAVLFVVARAFPGGATRNRGPDNPDHR
jgi:hypothetical protein